MKTELKLKLIKQTIRRVQKKKKKINGTHKLMKKEFL